MESVQDRSDVVRFAAAVTRDPAGAADWCAARGLRSVSTLDAALADPGVDGIVLATPHSRHAAEVIACARAGKAVLVEKPFALTRASAAEALKTASAAGIVVAAGHNRRWLAPVRTLKAMIDAGGLGTILHIETHFSGDARGRYAADAWRVAPGESPAGGLAGSGIHQIDAIIHLAGPIAQVYALSLARIHDVPLDDTTLVTFRLASGGAASLTTLTATAPLYRLTVFGTGGRAQIDGAAERRGSESLTLTRLDGSSETRTFEPFDIERAELEAFAAAISGAEPFPITPDEILNGVAAFEAVSLSVARGAPVAVA